MSELTVPPMPLIRTIRAYLSDAAFESLRLLRTPALSVPILAMPLIFYSFFGVDSDATSPSDNGTSGPTMTNSIFSRCAKVTSPAMSSAAIGKHPTSCAMPALPGAHTTRGFAGEASSARTSACSRPPEPTTRMELGNAA